MGTLEKPSRTIEKSNLSSTCNTKMNSVAVFIFLTACVSQMSAQPIEEPLEAPKCPDVYDGTEVYLRSKSNCEEYFQCVHGTPVLMQCPDGLYWDQSKEICNWPDQVALHALQHVRNHGSELTEPQTATSLEPSV